MLLRNRHTGCVVAEISFAKYGPHNKADLLDCAGLAVQGDGRIVLGDVETDQTVGQIIIDEVDGWGDLFMTEEWLRSMVSDWLSDNHGDDESGEYDDLEVNWESGHYNEATNQWEMECRDGRGRTYSLVAINGNIELR